MNSRKRHPLTPLRIVLIVILGVVVVPAWRYVMEIGVYDRTPAQALRTAEWMAAAMAVMIAVILAAGSVLKARARRRGDAVPPLPDGIGPRPRFGLTAVLETLVAVFFGAYLCAKAWIKSDPRLPVTLAPVLATGDQVYVAVCACFLAWLFWSVFYAKTNSH